MIEYFKNILIWFDQGMNTLIGGWPDETFSSRCWRRRGDSTWFKVMTLIDKVLFLQEQHCKQSYDSEKLRMQLPPELR